MRKEINDIADGMAKRYAELEDKQASLQARLLETQAELAALESATQRVERLRVGARQPPVDMCLHCLVLRGLEVTMIPIPSDGDSDWFRCRECGHEKESQP